MARSALLILLLALHVFASSAHAQAAPTHPRVASIRALQSDTPAVFIDSESAWINVLPEGALALCSASRCSPIARTEACAAPRCPGAGVLVHANERLTEVREFPRDYTGFNAEIAALNYVPELASVMRFQSAHPHPPGPPIDLVMRGSNDARFELGVDGGFVSSFDRPLQGALVSLRFAIVGQLDMNDDFDAAYIGNQLSLELAMHTWLAPVSDGLDLPMTLIGFHVSLANAVRHEPVRVPTVIAPLIPEVGIAIHPDLGRVDLYAMFGLEASLLLAPEVGLRLRTTATLIGNMDDTNLVEGIGMVTAGFFIPMNIDD